MSALPPPDPAQLAASRQLAARLADEIGAAGGWLGFDRWMAIALYEPGLGYYAGGSRKFGAEGDFVTAPEISPLFGRCVAAQCAQWFEQGAPATIHEFGAGTGVLAATILESLSEAGFDRLRYRIVELSGELRARQRELLAARVPAALARIDWLDALPERIEGVVLGNELLDAMPVRLFRLAGDEVLERGVTFAQTQGAGPAFAFAERAADPDFAAAVRVALADSGWAKQGGWPDGYASEFAEQAPAWVREIGARLVHGALLLIDYGFPRAEYFHPQRAQGTLMCHYRHRAHGDPLCWPGLQDITAHVDFSAIDAAARGTGLSPLGYASQARFLFGCGLAGLAMESGAGRAAGAGQVPVDDRTAGAGAQGWARQASALQRLVSEAEMGELFKAIAFGRGLPDDAIGFVDGDRRQVFER